MKIKLQKKKNPQKRSEEKYYANPVKLRTENTTRHCARHCWTFVADARRYRKRAFKLYRLSAPLPARRFQRAVERFRHDAPDALERGFADRKSLQDRDDKTPCNLYTRRGTESCTQGQFV